MSIYDDVEREGRHDWLDQRVRDAYRRSEAEWRDREDAEALDDWEQHADDRD